MLLEIEWLRSVSLWAHDGAKHLSNDASKQKIVLLYQEIVSCSQRQSQWVWLQNSECYSFYIYIKMGTLIVQGKYHVLGERFLFHDEGMSSFGQGKGRV